MPAAKSIHKKLLDWYKKNARDLPWRRRKDAYAIWLSEVMLQQTRVETVIPYYERFLRKYPSVDALASSNEDDLLNLWAGLGYYSRAKNLKTAARMVVDTYRSEFPNDPEELKKLKGIGFYTANAIASIAYGKPYIALDGNLERVLSRIMAAKADPKKEGRRALIEFGQRLVEFGHPSEVNQGLMDLSSSTCLPKIPRCDLCPVNSNCRAKELGLEKEIPSKKPKVPAIELRATGYALFKKDSILLARREKGEWLSGMWDLPWHSDSSRKRVQGLGAHFARSKVIRGITKYKIHFEVLGLECESSFEPHQSGLPGREFRWVRLEDLMGMNLPRPSERALEKLILERVSD